LYELKSIPTDLLLPQKELRVQGDEVLAKIILARTESEAADVNPPLPLFVVSRICPEHNVITVDKDGQLCEVDLASKVALQRVPIGNKVNSTEDRKGQGTAHELTIGLEEGR